LVAAALVFTSVVNPAHERHPAGPVVAVEVPEGVYVNEIATNPVLHVYPDYNIVPGPEVAPEQVLIPSVAAELKTGVNPSAAFMFLQSSHTPIAEWKYPSTHVSNVILEVLIVQVAPLP